MRTRVVVWFALITSSVARADDVDQAEALFKEAHALLKAGKVTEACEKFEASLRFNPQGLGALLNVASCDEKRGKVATAQRRYRLALDIAREAQNDAVRDEAKKKLGELENAVPHITITVGEMLPGLKIVVDDNVVAIDEKSGVLRDMPIDPGAHTLAATAPSRLPFDHKFSIVQSENKTIAIPTLVSPVKSSRKTISFIVGFSGLAVAGGAGILAFVGKAKYDAQFRTQPDGSLPHCTTDSTGTKRCDAAGQRNVERAQFYGDLATWIMVAGGAAVVTGGVLWFTAPKQPTETKLAVTPQVGPGQIGIVASGSF